MASDLSAPGRRRTALWIALAIGAVLAALVVVLATRRPATTRVAESPLVGRPAPQLHGQTIDQTPFRLEELRGRWVLVNFFATWCVPCRQEHPDLIRFARRHDELGDAAVVGVIYSDDVEAVRRFRAQQGGTWPMVQDPGGKVGLDFGVAGVPESFLVAPDGTIVAKIVGGVRYDQLERLLAEASGQPRRP